MSSTAYERLAESSKGARALARASLRSRVLGLLHRALDESGITQSELARRLEIRKSAVHRTLNGNGNVRLDTVADMLFALGYELHVTTADAGELRCAMKEQRAPALNSWLPGDTPGVRSCERLDRRGDSPAPAASGFDFVYRAISSVHVLHEDSGPSVEPVIQYSYSHPSHHAGGSGPVIIERLDSSEPADYWDMPREAVAGRAVEPEYRKVVSRG